MGARNYREEITQFFVGSDGRYVVFNGSRISLCILEILVLREILPMQQSKILTLTNESSFEPGQ